MRLARFIIVLLSAFDVVRSRALESKEGSPGIPEEIVTTDTSTIVANEKEGNFDSTPEETENSVVLVVTDLIVASEPNDFESAKESLGNNQSDEMEKDNEHTTILSRVARMNSSSFPDLLQQGREIIARINEKILEELVQLRNFILQRSSMVEAAARLT